MRPVRWVWDGRIPAGSLTLIPGREGIGKSLTLAWLAGQLTRGTLPGIHYGTPRPVIYAATEDSWGQTIAPRLYAAGADLDMVYRVDVDNDGAFDQLTLPRDCNGMAVEIEQLGVALLAADPLLSLIQAGIDTHRDRDLRTALEPLVKMADRTGCAVVGLAHFNKSDSRDALNLITGSRAFSAVSRAVMAIARDDGAGDGSCVMSQVKNNLGSLDVPSLRYIIESVEVPTEEGPASTGRLVFTGESDRSVADILSESGDQADSREERSSAASWLVGFLMQAGGEAAKKDVLKAARAEGIADRTLDRARQQARVTADRSGFGGGSVWKLALSDGEEPSAPFAPQLRHSRQVPERGANGVNGATAHAQSSTNDHVGASL
ncbi:AAA family ATPase [Catellatospora coxensis]|uniref:AAA domain-containing protein n=2 Tax=Catellatospora coxensis TaxID=310354 RepID=A0A8J3PBQ8_9ACTN|nr:AAA family ATPase [Catellatospora coxensis]GIG11626.1 hypothetical protein Cco03nite_83260 [Catellatospora coxensis]